MEIHDRISAGFDGALAGQVQVFVPAPGEHYTLPEDITKGRAVNRAAEALRLLGASPTEIVAFHRIASTTRREAWHSLEEAPVNHRRATDLARSVGVGERQWRRIERRLERFGALARTTADNGYRGRRTGQSGPVQCGLSLEPAIANWQAWDRLVTEDGIVEGIRQETLTAIRATRHRLRKSIDACPDGDLARDARARLDAIVAGGPECPREASPAEIDALHGSLLDLEADLSACAAEMEGMTEPGNSADGHTPPAPTGDDGAATPPAGDDGDTGLPPVIVAAFRRDRVPTVAGGGDGEMARRAGIPPAIARHGPDALLRDLAPGRVAKALAASRGTNDRVERVLRETGTPPDAWGAAVDAMGVTAALVALALADRDHPSARTRPPGDTLRTLTAWAMEGRLDLGRALAAARDTESRSGKGGGHTPDRCLGNDGMSGAADLNVRCHTKLQERKEFVDSKRSQTKMSGAEPSENLGMTPEIAEHLTPERLVSLATEDIAWLLRSVPDWRDALPQIRRELGISESAWNEAVDILGGYHALVALMVIDRNRLHPTKPIRSPGGALRAFTARAETGRLNLGRSVVAIWDRERKGVHPRTLPGRPD